MKQLITYIVTATVLIGLMNACGPSEEELERQEEARQDSIEQARQDSIEQVRQDSIEQARQDSIAEAEAEEERRNDLIANSDEGPYAVQIQAWRSDWKAEEELEKWQDEGFEHSFISEEGNEDTGDIWYRVILGQFEDLDSAEEFQEYISEEYEDVDSWVSRSSSYQD